MLDNAKVKAGYEKMLSAMEKSASAVQVYLGLKVPAATLGMTQPLFFVNTSYDHSESFNACLTGDYDQCPFIISDHAQIDPGLAPQGKGTLNIMTMDSYADWKNLSFEDYKRRKQEVVEKLVRRAEKYLPGLSGNIEVTEIATPRTMETFGSSPEGAIYGFAQNVKQSGIMRLSQETRVRGLFLAGAWTRPGGGVHGCFISGISAANLALRYIR